MGNALLSWDTLDEKGERLLAMLADKLVNVMDRALRPAAARLTGWLYRLIAPDAAE